MWKQICSLGGLVKTASVRDDDDGDDDDDDWCVCLQLVKRRPPAGRDYSQRVEFIYLFLLYFYFVFFVD
jgi:hypothetical protein